VSAPGIPVRRPLVRSRDKLRQWQHEEKLRYVLAFTLIITDMSYYWRLVGMPSLGANPVDNLPIGVCCWATIFCSFLVIGKSQMLFDIVYFWLFSGSLFALLTPTAITYAGPTRYRYYQFWLEHTLGYVAVFYMIFVHKLRPTVRSAVRSYIALVILAVIAYNVNVMLPGANYENSCLVCRRIAAAFARSHPHTSARLQFQVHPLEPGISMP